MRVPAYVICSLILFAAPFLPDASAQSTPLSANPRQGSEAPGPKSSGGPIPPARSDEANLKSKLNAWTVGLAAGQLEGAPIRFAAELARVLDDGDNMRVVPMVTRGPFDNVFDLLYLRGVDAAIVHGDVLDHFKRDRKVAGIERRISYLMPLFPSEVHVFVRPEIKKLEDLAGKPVNFNTPGTAAAYSGPMIFERLGIKVDARFVPHPVAMGEIANSDKYAAVVFVSSKPLDPFIKRKWPEGYKFLGLPFTEKLEEYYVPAQLEPNDYPGLIPEGQIVQTIAVPSVLAVYDWRQDGERQKRISRLVDYLFERFSKLQTEPGYHPKWKDLNLAATAPGWQRFAPMQAKLTAINAGIDKRAAAGQQRQGLPGERGEQKQKAQPKQ
jgi:TRAP-type uncharacterized transport system substrate-binding protein